MCAGAHFSCRRTRGATMSALSLLLDARNLGSELSVNLDDAIQRYIDYIRIERGLSDNTVQAYARDLAALSQWLYDQKIGDVSSVSIQDLRAFLLHRLESGRSSRTLARNVVTIRRFFLYVFEERYSAS